MEKIYAQSSKSKYASRKFVNYHFAAFCSFHDDYAWPKTENILSDFSGYSRTADPLYHGCSVFQNIRGLGFMVITTPLLYQVAWNTPWNSFWKWKWSIVKTHSSKVDRFGHITNNILRNLRMNYPV
ncbi:MAG: hypothetical protein ABIN24_01065 [Dyadobacter sp.]